MRWIAARTINAPADRLFRTVADPGEFIVLIAPMV